VQAHVHAQLQSVYNDFGDFLFFFFFGFSNVTLAQNEMLNVIRILEDRTLVVYIQKQRKTYHVPFQAVDIIERHIRGPPDYLSLLKVPPPPYSGHCTGPHDRRVGADAPRSC
jgi:hypothetical protein